MKITAPLTLLRTLLGVLVGGAVLAVALVWQDRGPDPALMPEMVAFQAPGHALYVQTHEVTLRDWNRCHAAGACALNLRAPVGRDAETFPATGLSWVDANEYITWINQAARHDFRLPSREEWRAMAVGVLPEAPSPIFTDPDLTWAASYLAADSGSRRLEPSGSHSISADGIADLDGNVWEWTTSCVQNGTSVDRCPAFYVMGEHEAEMSFLIRDPARGGCAMGIPPAHLGLRLVSDTPA